MPRKPSWNRAGFRQMSALRKTDARKGKNRPNRSFRSPQEKIGFVRDFRVKELRALINGLTRAKANTLLSAADKGLLLNGHCFTDLVKYFVRVMHPEELRPEYFSVLTPWELVVLGNKRPDLRYARFFERGQNIEVAIGQEKYRGRVHSVEGTRVSVVLRNQVVYGSKAQAGYRLYPIDPFTREFSLANRNLVRVVATKNKKSASGLEALLKKALAK